MAPKRRKVSSSKASTSQAFDSRKFISLAASERYNTNLVKRRCIQERGFLATCTIIDAIIERRKWVKFSKQPEAGVLPVVREFYANVAERLTETGENAQQQPQRDLRAFVRGKRVLYDRTAINSFFELADLADPDFAQTITDDAIIANLCEWGAEVEISKKSPLAIPTILLQREAKAWFYFIAARLMPTTHISDVIRERAALIFAIQNDIPVDVGYVIQESIISCAQGSTTGGLAHPSLITALCRKAGVVWDKTEEILHPKAEISKESVWGYKTWKASDANPQGAKPSNANVRIPPPKSTAARIGLLDAELQEQRQDIRALSHTVHQFVTYQVAFNTALTQALSIHEAHPVQFPQPPDFTTAPSAPTQPSTQVNEIHEGDDDVEP